MVSLEIHNPDTVVLEGDRVSIRDHLVLNGWQHKHLVHALLQDASYTNTDLDGARIHIVGTRAFLSIRASTLLDCFRLEQNPSFHQLSLIRNVKEKIYDFELRKWDRSTCWASDDDDDGYEAEDDWNPEDDPVTMYDSAIWFSTAGGYYQPQWIRFPSNGHTLQLDSHGNLVLLWKCDRFRLAPDLTPTAWMELDCLRFTARLWCEYRETEDYRYRARMNMYAWWSPADKEEVASCFGALQDE